jgi:hypothetical protein
MKKLVFFPITKDFDGSTSGSASQRYGSEDPNQHPDPYQTVTDPAHCNAP